MTLPTARPHLAALVTLAALTSCGPGAALPGSAAGTLDGMWMDQAWEGSADLVRNDLAPPGGRPPYEFPAAVVSRRAGGDEGRQEVALFAVPPDVVAGTYPLGRAEASVATVVGGDARVSEYRSVGAPGDRVRIEAVRPDGVEGTVEFRAVRTAGASTDTVRFSGRFVAARAPAGRE